MGHRLLLPKLTDVLFIAVFLASVLLGNRMLNTDGDLGRDLTVGRLIITSGTIPTTDVLSWSKAGEPRPPYEWLTQATFALAERVGGLDAIVLLVSTIIGLGFVIVFADAVERSGLPVTSLLLAAWAAIASSLHWLARPHVLSFLFLAVWLRELERLRTDATHRPWALPVLMLLWANSHGGFVFGFAAWLAYVAGWLWDSRRGKSDQAIGRNLLLGGALSLVASVITPDLWGNWQAILANRSAYVLSQTAETQPPPLTLPGTWPFLALAGLALFLGIMNAKRLQTAHVLLILGLGLAAVLMARNIPLFAIAAAPVLALWARELLERTHGVVQAESGFARIQSGLLGYAWPTLTVILCIGVFLVHWDKSHSSFYRFEPRVFPVGATDWISENRPQGRMFNDLNWGGYLLYRLWPSQRVYIDSQTDFYGEAAVRQNAQVLSATPGWDQTLEELQVAWVVIPPNSALAGQMTASSDWEESYRDETAAVFVRSAP